MRRCCSTGITASSGGSGGSGHPPAGRLGEAVGSIDQASLLAQFDAEMRIDPPPEAGRRVESVAGVVRTVGHDACITYSKLNEASADRAIEEQAAYFASLGVEVEWKVYGHDRPPDLGARLAAHGFDASEPETLLVVDLARDLPLIMPLPDVEIRRVRDAAGLDDLSRVTSAAFGRDERRRTELFRARLGDPTLGLYVAYAGADPVAAGRLEMPRHRSFASLWGGGTAPAYRGRGIYRALVAARAGEARRLGYRYLRVDARETSRPILEGMGFVSLTTITEWVLPRSAAAR